MAEKKLTDEQRIELHEQFKGVDEDGNGYLCYDEIQSALHTLNLKLAGYEVRDILANYDKDGDGRIDMAEFERLFIAESMKRDKGHIFKKSVSTRKGIQSHEGMSQASSEGTTHTVKDSELIAFSDWINTSLDDDPDCKKYLPLKDNNLCVQVTDGIILCKLLNKAQPDLIDERTINKTNLTVFRKHENLTLALGSAQSIGCSIVNIGAEDIEKGKIHLVLGLIWQIIRIGLLSDINLQSHPGLVLLLEEDEDPSVLLKLSPEQLLLRWVNFHLKKSGVNTRISNFGDDIRNSEAYIYLLSQIAPEGSGVTVAPINIGDLTERADGMLGEADKIGCRSFVTSKDVVAGNPKLNLAFVANLFNTYPCLDTEGKDVALEVIEETREEKTYRNWINSLGLQPYVNYLYSDLTNGIIIFKLFDQIKPNLVDWKKVIVKFQKMKLQFEKIENCNYAIDLAHKCNMSVVNIGGKDIYEGNATLTLALVWQLMRAYTLRILTDLAKSDKPIMEEQILLWANQRLASSDRIRSFGDPSLRDGRIILELLEKIKPGCVNWSLFKNGKTPEENLLNAKYAISLARKVGSRPYALPEDIVEGKKEMVMTVFACLMTLDNPYREDQQQVIAQMMDGLQA